MLGACSTNGGSNPTPERADTQVPTDRHVISFANLPGRINSWRADGSQGIYLEVGVNQWYHATFMSRCTQLPFSEAIGIVTDGVNQVDRFSSIVVESPTGWERCWFRTFERIAGKPPSR